MSETHEHVKKMLEDKEYAEKCKSNGVIKQSDLWNTNQVLKKIMQQLASSYYFNETNKKTLEELIQTMFSFINALVKPDTEKASEEVVEQIVEDVKNCRHYDTGACDMKCEGCKDYETT